MSPMVKLPLGIEHALLGFLRERDLHAYEIHQTLLSAQQLGLVWRIKQSHLYALLNRLEEEGCVRGATEQQGTRPPRKVLSLTPIGRDVFDRWMQDPVEHGRDFRLEFLAKWFFVRGAGDGKARLLLDRQRSACAGWLRELRTQEEAQPGGTYDRLVFEFRRGQIEAILSWLDKCESTLAAPASQR